MAHIRVLTAILLFGLAVPDVQSYAIEGPTLRGQVVSPEGPVAGASVSLSPMVGNYGLGAQFLGFEPLAAPVSETKTDADGRFVVVAPTVEFWDLRLEAEGFAPLQSVQLNVVEDTHLGRLELKPAEALEVRVTDPDGKPVTARLSIFRTSSALRGADFQSLGRRWRVASTRVPGSPWHILPTDSEGRLTVNVANDERLVVRATAPGFVAAETIRRGGGSVRLKLDRGFERKLHVVGVNGRGLPRVMLFDERAEVPLTATDDDGRAVVTWEATAALRIVLLDALGRRGSVRIAPPPPEEEAEEITVTLDEPVALSGRVIDRFTRQPIVNALVWSDDLENHTHTDPTGRYELHRLSQRAWVVGLKTGYVRAQIPSENSELTPTLVLHPTITLAGRAVDRLGDPVGGVDIEVSRDLGRSDASVKYSGWGNRTVQERTGDDGTFEAAGLPARMAFRLTASGMGWARTRLEIEPLEPFARRDGLHLILDPGRRAVGEVFDENDEPVAGATVKLVEREEGDAPSRDPRASNPPSQLKAQTDAEGDFAIADAASGFYDLDIKARGYAPAKTLAVEIFDSDEDTDLGSFQLAPGAAVLGRVVDREAQPVRGAEVRVSNDPALPVSQVRRALAMQPVDAISDARGEFSVASQAPGAPVTLVVESKSHLPTIVSGLTAPTSTPVEVVLRSPSTVSGRVVDPQGAGVTQAHLILVPEGQAGSGGYGGPLQFADSRDDGTFEIHRVPSGRITLISSAVGLQDLRVSGLEVPEAAELSDVELAMRAGAAIEGFVLDPDGEPVVNAIVKILDRRWARKFCKTDGDGRYRINGLIATTIPLAADHQDFPRVAREVTLDLGTNVVDLVFGGGVAVSGSVRDDSGQPVAGAWVRLVRAIRTRHSPGTVTRDDGSFLFPGVAKGDYFVDAGRRGFAEHRHEPAISVLDQPIAGVELELKRGVAVRGQILGLRSSELAQLEITAYGRLGSHSGEIGPGRQYRVDHLAPGDWTILAALKTSGRSVVEIMTIEPDEIELDLDLDFASGFALTGTASHGGLPLQGARVGARGLSVAYAADTTTDRDGAFRLEGLDKGRYWLGLYDFASGRRHSEEFEVNGDEELRIELVTDKVSGLVTNAFDHEPVADARVMLEPVLENQQIAARLLQPSGLSDSSGYFSLGDVSHGRYELVIAVAGYAESRTLLDVKGPWEGMELELTPTEGIFFELSLAGAPVAWATVVVLDGERPVARGTWSASENGRLRITGVPPGNYEMLLWAPGSATLSRQVLSPGALGPVALPRGGRVDVIVPELANDGTVAFARLIGADGSAYRSVVGAQVEHEFRMVGGRTAALGVPAGTWTVVVEAADGRTWTGKHLTLLDQTTVATLD